MVWVLLTGLGLATGALVVLVEGLEIFAAWNLVPVVFALVACVFGARQFRSASRAARIGLAMFCVVTLACVALVHLAWRFDWGATATGSSTSGLIFLFVPVYSVAVGAVVAAVAVMALGLAGRRRSGA